MAANFTRIEVETGKFKTIWFSKTQVLFMSQFIEREVPNWFTFYCQIFDRHETSRTIKLYFKPASKIFWNGERLAEIHTKNIDNFFFTSINLNKFIEAYCILREQPQQSFLPLFISCCINHKFYVLTPFEFENMVIKTSFNSTNILKILKSTGKLIKPLRLNKLVKSEVEIRFLKLFKVLTLGINFICHVICKR